MTARQYSRSWRLAVALSGATPLLFSAHPGLARAGDDGPDEPRLARCIREAAGGHGWLEKTLWGLRDQEGGWIGAEVPNRNGSHDLGPLQVNSWWVPKLAILTGHTEPQVRHWLVHDACFNVNSARWIFLSSLALTQDYWDAIGVYHSPTRWRQRHYALSVARKLERRFGAEVFGRGTLHRGEGSVGSARSAP